MDMLFYGQLLCPILKMLYNILNWHT